jgi:thiol-disulfide isomerase/thioredoxin
LPGVTAQAASEEQKVVIYFFWGDGCPHCASEKPFLEALAKKNSNIEVRAYEVWNSQPNQEKFIKMAALYGFDPQAVPTTFVGDRHWVGYNDAIRQQIESTVNNCLKNGCPDKGLGLIVPGASPPPANPNPAPIEPLDPNTRTIEVPLFGTINLENQSLLVSTLLISFVDGVNPCSIWVLTMLMALTVHTGSRRKIFVVGFVFLSITAAVYAIFIVGLFSIFTVVSFVGWVQVVVALIALVFGLINIKDYFWYKEGVSLTISEKAKPGLFEKMRRVVSASNSLPALIGATVVLAGGVSLVEFSCTAGFPVLWTNLLTSQKVEPLTFGLLLLVYMLIYQLDELVIFFTVVFTLRASRLEEKQGRILKLVGGTLMVALAAVMVVNPTLMNSLANSLLVFAAAGGAALLILLLHRHTLPAMGIYIGSEFRPKKKGAARRSRPR